MNTLLNAACGKFPCLNYTKEWQIFAVFGLNRTYSLEKERVLLCLLFMFVSDCLNCESVTQLYHL